MILPSRPIVAADVAAHYDALDRYYRALWGPHVHHGLWITGRETAEQAVDNLVTHVATRLGAPHGARVCDVGCGYGATARALAARYGLRVTGLTISREQHAYAVAVGGDPDNPRYRLEDWQTNGLAAESFDGLISIECVSHVERKEVYFEQVRRVLAPGGRAVVVAWLACDRPSSRQCRRLLEPICREGRLPGLATRGEYDAWIADAGLRQTGFEDLTARVGRTWDVCIARLFRYFAPRPAEWKLLVRGDPDPTVFLRSVFRIRRAYRTGAMRYGLFTLERPPGR